MLHIESIQAFHGPNIYSSFQGILLSLSSGNSKNNQERDSEFSFPVSPVDLEGLSFIEKIVRLISYFVAKERRQPFPYQSFGTHNDSASIFIETSFPNSTVEAAKHVVDIINQASDGRQLTNEDWERSYDYFMRTHGIGMNTRLIVSKAGELDFPHYQIHQDLIQYGYGRNRHLMWGSVPEETSVVAVDMTVYKSTLERFLRDIGYRVPVSYKARTIQEAIEYAEAIGYPVVMKPLTETFGAKTYANLESKEEIREAFQECCRTETEVLIQEWIPGSLYRIIVVGQSVFAIQNHSPRIVGDGTHTVSELVEMENSRSERGEHEETSLVSIPQRLDFRMTLKKQNASPDSIPPEGKNVTLASVASMNVGGTSEDVSQHLHPLNASLARRIAEALRLSLLEIHVITDSISEPITEDRGTIVALSPQLEVRNYHYPFRGKERDVEELILRNLESENSDFRIPITAISGSHGKTIVASLLNHLLRMSGRQTGLACSTGVNIAGNRITSESGANHEGHKMVLADPTVGFAILEQSALDTVSVGLAYRDLTNGIILNSYESPEDFPDLSRRMTEGRRLLASKVKSSGKLIINTQIPEFEEIVSGTESEIVIISREPDHPLFRDLQRDNHLVATVMGKMLVLIDHGKMIPLVSYLDAPLTYDGIAHFNIENLLAASVAAYANGVETSEIRNALLTFSNSPEQLPGAMNLFEIQTRHIFVDLATKPSNIGIASRFVNRYKRRMDLGDIYGLLRLPSGLSEEAMRNILADISDYYKKAIVHETEYPESVYKCGECFDVVPTLEEGMTKMKELLRPDDILLVTTNEPHKVINLIKQNFEEGDF